MTFNQGFFNVINKYVSLCFVVCLLLDTAQHHVLQRDIDRNVAQILDMPQCSTRIRTCDIATDRPVAMIVKCLSQMQIVRIQLN